MKSKMSDALVSAESEQERLELLVREVTPHFPHYLEDELKFHVVELRELVRRRLEHIPCTAQDVPRVRKWPPLGGKVTWEHTMQSFPKPNQQQEYKLGQIQKKAIWRLRWENCLFRLLTECPFDTSTPPLVGYDFIDYGDVGDFLCRALKGAFGLKQLSAPQNQSTNVTMAPNNARTRRGTSRRGSSKAGGGSLSLKRGHDNRTSAPPFHGGCTTLTCHHSNRAVFHSSAEPSLWSVVISLRRRSNRIPMQGQFSSARTHVAGYHRTSIPLRR